MFSQRLRWYIAMVPVLLSAALMAVHGATIKFDQSQTGDYNLQIHLKNIELYAVFDDSGGSDDEYGDLPDYTDPTDAPSKPPSSAPSVNSSTSATTKAPPPPPSVTDATIVSTAASTLLDPYSPSNSEKIVQMVEALIASNGNTSDLPTEPPAVAATPSPPPPPSQSSSGAIATASTSASSGTNNRNKCGLGYFRDPMGRCRRIRKPHLPFLQMVHTPGVIKSFQPQQRTTGDISATTN